MDQRLVLKLGLIALGGGLGSVLRYLIAGWVQPLARLGFPLGTLVVNVTGCLAIGFLHAYFNPRLVREEYRIAILVGVLGGYTTFSTFGYETFTLTRAGEFARAAANVLLSVLLGLAAVWIGYRVGQRLFGP
jgi:CrcB protein